MVALLLLSCRSVPDTTGDSAPDCMHGQNIDDARYELATTACAWWVECGGDLASLDNCIYNQLVLMEDPLAQDQCLDRCGAAAWLEIARQKECPQYPDELAADLLSLFGECEP